AEDDRQNIFAKMIHKLIHRLQPLLTSRAAWNYDAFATCCDCRWVVNEGIPSVTLQLLFRLFEGHHRGSLSPRRMAGDRTETMFCRIFRAGKNRRSNRSLTVNLHFDDGLAVHPSKLLLILRYLLLLKDCFQNPAYRLIRY